MDCQPHSRQAQFSDPTRCLSRHPHADDPLFLCDLRDGARRPHRFLHGCDRVPFLRTTRPRASSCAGAGAERCIGARLSAGGPRDGGEISLHVLPEPARCRCAMGGPGCHVPGLWRQDSRAAMVASPALAARGGLRAQSESNRRPGCDPESRRDRISQPPRPDQTGSGRLTPNGKDLHFSGP